MNKYVFVMAFLCLSFSFSAQIKVPSLSPLQEVRQKIGLTEVIVKYSRPSLRDRSLFGENGILMYGDKWRTGANGATQFEVSNNIDINGNELPKGVYAILTTPEQDSCAFHFFNYERSGYTAYLKKNPLLTVKVPVNKSNEIVESLSLNFDKVGIAEATFIMQWGAYRAEVPIKVNERKSIMANIDKTLSGPSKFDYYLAALYLQETGSDLPLALSYIQKANEGDGAPFFQVYREALILRDLNRRQEAVIAAKKSMELSEKAGNQDLVRLSRKIIEQLE